MPNRVIGLCFAVKRMPCSAFERRDALKRIEHIVVRTCDGARLAQSSARGTFSRGKCVSSCDRGRIYARESAQILGIALCSRTRTPIGADRGTIGRVQRGFFPQESRLIKKRHLALNCSKFAMVSERSS